MAWEKTRKRANRTRNEKEAKQTKAFRTLLKELDKRKRHFIGRMITNYQMTEREAIASWTRIHPETPEEEVKRMIGGEPETEDRLPEEQRDFVAETMFNKVEGENNG